MGTEISKVIDRAYDKMKEYKFMEIGRETADVILGAYVPSACSAYSEKRGKDLEIDEDMGMLSEDLDFRDLDILSAYVCIFYIDANYIRTTLSMKPFLSGTDFHAYGNKDMLVQVMKARDSFKAETDRFAVVRSYRDKDCPFWKVAKRRR